MWQGHFDKPTFINEGAQALGGKFEFLDATFPGTSEVKEIRDALGTADESERRETKHFFIKQIKIDPSNLYELGVDYREKNDQLEVIYGISKKLQQDGNASPTAEDIMASIQEEAHAEKSYLKAAAQKWITDKHGIATVKQLMDMLSPLAIAKAERNLWLEHKRWYRELPDFVVDQMHVVGEGTDGKPHVYVITRKITSSEDEPNYIDLGVQMSNFRTNIGMGREEDLKNHLEVIEGFIAWMRQYLNTAQQEIFANELKKFVTITQNIINQEDTVIDLGLVYMGANIRITPEGHLRMIDTDRVYPAIESRPAMGSARRNAEAVLDAFEHIADHLVKS